MAHLRKLRKRIDRLRLFIISIVFFLCIGSVIFKFPLFNQTFSCSQVCPYSSALINDTLHFDPSHTIVHFPNFVCPQNFRNLADWIYGWPNQFLEHIKVTTNQGQVVAPCLPSGSIIYVRIWVISEFFDQVYPHLHNDFVLITGEGDMSSPTHLEQLEAPDSKIIHWFGQNGQYDVSKSKKFTHLPIGINCYEMAKAIQSIHSQHPNHTLPPVFNDTDELFGYIQPQDASHRALTATIPPNNLVLLNFDIGTDRTRLRSRLWRTICHPKNEQNFTFATCIQKPNGVHIDVLPKIYERNRQYPFWLSPRGGGLDCHRTWEALYLDIIPIVWNNSLNVLYENLPVLVINDYAELNEKFLYTTLTEMSRNKVSKQKVYQYERLRHAYWRRLILNKSRHREKKNVHERANQCWRARRTINWKRIFPFL